MNDAQVKLATIVMKATQKSIVKLKADTVGCFCKWIICLGGGKSLVDEFLAFHAEEVDPTQLSCSALFFEEVAKLPKQYPLAKLALTMCQYTAEAVLGQTRPLPDVCRFIAHSELNALAKDEEKLKAMEQVLQETRVGTSELLQAGVGSKRAQSLLRMFQVQGARFFLAKSQSGVFHSGVQGKMTPEKVLILRKNWFVYCATHEPLKNLGVQSGLLAPTAEGKADEVLDAIDLDENHQVPEEADNVFSDLGFSVGVHVAVVKRITVEFGSQKYRKDVPKGAKSTIVGFAGDKVAVPNLPGVLSFHRRSVRAHKPNTELL